MGTPWANKSWSLLVRQHFKQHLYFFRLSPAKSRIDVVREKIGALKNQLKIAGLNAHIVFGPYDVMIRAWLHQDSVEPFAQQLYLDLGLPQTPDYFQANRNQVQASRPQRELLNKLDDWEVVKAIQNGNNPGLLEELVNLKMVNTNQGSHPESIRFLMTVGEGAPNQGPDKLLGITDRIRTKLQDSRGFISSQIHIGHGMCQILLEAEIQVTHFFEIGSLTTHLLNEYAPHGLHSQSYIFANSDPLIRGFDVIDDRALLDHRPKDHVVTRFCPEAYEYLTPNADEIIEFLISNRKPLNQLTKSRLDELTSKTIINVCAAALSEDDLDLVWANLMSFVAFCESALRNGISPILPDGEERINLFRAKGIQPGKHISLGDICKLLDRLQSTTLETDLAALVNLRNKLAHGDDVGDWKSGATVILQSHQCLTAAYRAVSL